MRLRKARLRQLSEHLDRDARKTILQSKCARPLPKVLWIFWRQGAAAAPEMVKYCIHSWRTRNRGWDVRVIDENDLLQFIDMGGLPGSMGVHHYADVLRVRLLDEHGGVWADATTFCGSP